MNYTVVQAGARRLFVPATLAFALVTGGCSLTDVINDQGKIEYKSAGKLPSLEVPPDLVSPRGDDRFGIPERQPRTASGFQTARTTERPAAQTSVLPTVEGARVMRDGSQRWLFVNQSPDKVWPLVREFWQESGFLIQSENPATGVMETDWAENRAKIPMDPIRSVLGKALDTLYSTGERDKFRTRLEAADGGTEIYISHRGMVEVLTGNDKDSSSWQPRPNDPELEAEFLRRLLVKLGADQERAKTLVANAQPGASQLVGMGADGKSLELREGFDRAWRRVGLALDRGGFTVEDRDRSQGLYFVRYIDPESGTKAKSGFFSRLFSSSSKTEASRQQYQVRLASSADLTTVTVAGKDGQALTSDVDKTTGEKILAVLREQLQQ
jgi:outer membrane protein assembly factor BamC